MSEPVFSSLVSVESLDPVPLVVNLSLKASVVLAIAFAVDFWARRKAKPASATSRHLGWMFGFLVLAAIPALSSLPAISMPWLPAELAPSLEPAFDVESQLSVPVSPIDSSEPASSLERNPWESSKQAVFRSDLESSGPRQPDHTPLSRTESEVRGNPNRDLPLILSQLWIVGLVVGLAHLTFQLFKLVLLARFSSEISDPAWSDILARRKKQLGIRRPISLRRNRWIQVPMTFGTWSPTIVLPAKETDSPLRRREIILLHELAHIRRMDFLSNLILRVVQCAYWPLPWVHRAARHVALLREQASDDHVLSSGTPSLEYASELLQTAKSLRRREFFQPLAVPFSLKFELRERVTAIVDSSRSRTLFAPRATLFCLALSLFSGAILGCVSLTARPQSPFAVDLALASDPQPHSFHAPRLPRGADFQGTIVGTFHIRTGVGGDTRIQGRGVVEDNRDGKPNVLVQLDGVLSHGDHRWIGAHHQDVELLAEIQGDATYHPDHTPSLRLNPGSLILLESTEGSTRKNLRVSISSKGRATFTFWRQGKVSSFGPAERAWMDRCLRVVALQEKIASLDERILDLEGRPSSRTASLQRERDAERRKAEHTLERLHDDRQEREL